MKRCPLCHKEFADTEALCATDGHLLEADSSHLNGDEDESSGRTLSDVIGDQAPMKLERAVGLAASICEAVDGLHRAGRVIGSLHPDNILPGSDPNADGRSLQIRTERSTPASRKELFESAAAYMSPEAAQQLEVDARADVYSIGVILYQMLTAQLPFVASSAAALIVKQLLERPRPPRDFRPEIPTRLQDVILRALSKEGTDRQRSCAQLKRELEESLDTTGEDQSSQRKPTGALMPTPVGPARFDSTTVVASSAAASGSSKKLFLAAIIGAAILSAMFATMFLVRTGSPKALKTDAAKAPETSASPPDARPPGNANTSKPRDNSNRPNRNTNANRPKPDTSQTAPPPGPEKPGPILPAPADDRVFPTAAVVLITIVVAGAAFAIILILRRKVSQQGPALEVGMPAVPPTVQAPLAAQPSTAPAPGSGEPSITRHVSDTAETIKAPPDRQLAREIIKRCPACQMELPTTAQFCVYDGSLLTEEVKLVPPKESPSYYDLQSVETNMRCPKCGEQYSPATKFCRFDGARLVLVTTAHQPPDQTAEMEPFLIGQYRCFARLGEGGMGIVYKAQHIHLKRLSAVKVLLPQTALIPDAVRMFRREAQLASSINHPNSVIIYDYGEVDAHLFYLAMEFIPGKSLANIIEPIDQTPCPLPLPRVLDITRQICDALNSAHQSGIIHRDLKPQNVMVCERPNGPDVVKVVDFGIARSLGVRSEHDTVPGTVMGTPAYMSPEQALAETDLDARSDIFSVGVMVYQMLSGALPFPARGLSLWRQIDERGRLQEPPQPLRKTHPYLNIPADIDEGLRRALEPDRNRRTQSVIQFVKDLERSVRT